MTASSSSTLTSYPTAALPVPFNPYSVVLSRIGDGSAALGSGSAAVYLDEYSPSGTRVQSILAPAMSMYTANPVISASQYQVGVPVPLGLLTRSLDGTAISLAGPNVAVGNAYSAVSVTWTFATLSYNAVLNSATQVSDHYSGDMYSNAVSNGTSFYIADTISSSTNSALAGYTVSCIPIGYSGSYTEPGQVVAHYFGAKFVDFHAGNLFIAAQYVAGSSQPSAFTFSTDLWMTAGMPSSYTAASWVPLGVGATMQAPRAFTFMNATTIFVADAGAGMRRVLQNATGGWTADPAVYVPSATDTGVLQVTTGADGATVYAVTPTALYAFNAWTLIMTPANETTMLRSINALLALVEANDLPLSISLDPTQWWQSVPSIFNWFDPSQPGYDASNAANVEWTAPSPINATAISWRNWGSQVCRYQRCERATHGIVTFNCCAHARTSLSAVSDAIAAS